MTATAHVVCLGLAVLDHVFTVPEIPPEPVKVHASKHIERGGGMAATAAVAVAALGGSATYWGRLGDDTAGDSLTAAMALCGVDTGGVRRVHGGHSPTAAVLVDPVGERLIAAFAGSCLEDDDTSWLPLADLGGVSTVLGDCRWPQGSLALFAAARTNGIPSVLDADLAESERLWPLVAACDHAVFSLRGLRALVGDRSTEAALQAVTARTDASVGVTLGADGYLWREGTKLRRLSGHLITARDTTGAGDTFHGAYALCLARGLSTGAAAAFANAAAALKCSRGDGWAGMPTAADVEAFMTERGDADYTG